MVTGMAHASQAGMQEQALVCGEQGEGTWLQLLWVTWAVDYVINCSSFLWKKREALFEDKTWASGKQPPLLCLSFNSAFFAASPGKRLTKEVDLVTE